MHEKDACNNNSKVPSINYVVSKLTISDTLFVVIFYYMFSFSKYFPKTCSYFQNTFRNELRFSKCVFFKRCFHFQIVKGFVSFFPFSEKHNCKHNFQKKNCTVTTNSFTDEVVRKQGNIYKAFDFVSVIKNL